MAIRRQRYHGARARRLRPELLEHRLMLASDLAVDADWFGGSTGAALVGANESSAAPTSRWMVQLTDQAVAQAGGAAGAPQLLAGVPLAGVRGLGLPGQLLVEATGTHSHIASRLAASPHVDFFQLDATLGGAQVPNDPRFAQDQYALFNTGLDQGTFDADIDADLAWDLTTGSTDVVVAIIDSGIDYTHPDVDANIWTSPGGILGPDMVTLVTNGWDFANNDDDPIDDHGHGTHVAGIVGAEGDNGLGTAGVNWDVSLLPIKLLDENNAGSVADAVEAINFATLLRTRDDVNIRVINASWGGVGIDNPMLEDAIREAGEAGILFVAAAGNGDVFGRGQNLAVAPFFPASFDLDNVLTVGATDRNDLATRFSNFGQAVDLSAPGQSIWSTDLLVDSGQQIHSTRSGTSMAAPHVAGVAALAWDLAPDATVAEIREAILAGGEAKAALQGQSASQKRLNALGALNALRPQATITTADDIDNDDLNDTTYQFTVTLTKPSGQNLDRTSIGDGDFFIRKQGETEELTATLASSQPTNNQPEYTDLIYQFTPPGGSWDPVDTGAYEIVLAAGEVTDINGGASAQKVVATFEANFTGASIFRPNVFFDSPDANVGDGMADDGNGNTTLRNAIQEANELTGSGTIILAPGTYTLSFPGRGEDAAVLGDLDITGSVTIASDGAGKVIIDADGIDRVFDVHVAGELTLNSVTVTGGAIPEDRGGGVNNLGNLVAINSTFTNNTAAQAGGIHNAPTATATLTGSNVSSNSTTPTSDGVLDSTFGTGGIVTTNFGGFDKAKDVAIQSDGRIVVVGRTGDQDDNNFVVVRYLPNGSLDPSFSSDGMVITDLSPSHDRATSVAIQDDGKLVVGGSSSDSSFAIVRYNTDGSLDTTFSSDGVVETDFGSEALGSDLAIQSDGKIVIVGSVGQTGDEDFGLARFNIDGTLDTSFSQDGLVTTNFSQFADLASSVVIQEDGKIVVFGETENGSGEDYAFARYNPDGSLDTTFAGDGLFAVDGESSFGIDRTTGLALQADGKIVAAGNSFSGDWTVMRLDVDGTLDTTFAGDGLVVTPLGPFDSAQSVAVQEDGKILAAGYSDGPGGSGFAVVRYLANGLLDETFGDNGVFGFRLEFDFFGDAEAIAFQSGGRIIVVGNSGNSGSDFVVFRLHPEPVDGGGIYNSGSLFLESSTISGNTAAQRGGGIFNSEAGNVDLENMTISLNRSSDFGATVTEGDPDFSDDGKASTGPFIVRSDVALDVAVQEDGMFVTAGYREFNGEVSFLLTRFDRTGQLDDSFGGGGLITTEIGLDARATSIELLPDGKILVGGTSDGDFALARYNRDGSLDQSFGTNGVETTDIVFGANDSATGIGVLSDGKIIVAGTSDGSNNGNDFALVRYSADGVLDSFFGLFGRRFTDFNGGSDEAFDMLILPDDKILVVGSSESINGDKDFAVARYLSDGTPDGDFNQSKVSLDLAGMDDVAKSLAVQPDGKIVLVGTSEVAPGDTDFALARLNANGSIDASFSGGSTITHLSDEVEVASGVVIGGDGSLIVGGYSAQDTADFVVARYHASGILDPEFAIPLGTIRGDFGGDDQAFGLAGLSDGGVVLAGATFSNPDTAQVALLKLNVPTPGGAGIFNLGSLTANHATIYQNDSDGLGGGLVSLGSATASLSNSIVAGNVSGRPLGDVSGGYVSLGGNLIGDGENANGFTQLTDQVGTNASPIDPLLGPLADNGGPTLTHRPILGSLVIDAGVGSLAVDQRGVARTVDGDGNSSAVVDVGAVELFYASLSGSIFQDFDGNGVIADPAVPLVGWVVFLDENENGQRDVGELSTVTDEDGNYRIDLIEPGTIPILQESPEGWVRTFRTTLLSTVLVDGQQDAQGATITGLTGVRDLVFSPDGQFAYAYSDDDLETNRSLLTFRRNRTTGNLEFVQDLETAAVAGDGRLRVGPNNNLLYQVDETGSLVEYPLDGLTGEIDPAFVSILSAGDTAEDFVLSPDGQNIYAISSGGDGRLRSAFFDANQQTWLELPEVLLAGNNLAVTPNGKWVYAANTASVAIYSRDPSAGLLSTVVPLRSIASGITDIEVSPDGKHLYFLASNSLSIRVYQIDDATGEISFVENISRDNFDSAGTIVGGLLGAIRLALNSDGTRLYALSDGSSSSNDTLAVFQRETDSGRLLFDDVLGQFTQDPAGNLILNLTNPSAVAVSPTDGDLFVASHGGAITRFTRDGEGIDQRDLEPGDHLNIHFSNFAGTGEIRGTVFNDQNNDGLRDPAEDGLSGVQVYLDLDLSGDLTGGEPTTTTDVLGSYSFDNLETPRNYRVRLELASGQEVTSPDAAAGFERSIDLQPQEVFVGADFLVHVSLTGQSANSVINGIVFADANGDGVKQPGEAPLAGRRVYLDTNDNAQFDPGVDVAAPNLTDANGQYQFINLSAADFVVRVDTNPGETTTSPLGNTFAGLELPTGQNPLGLEAVDLDGQHGLDLISIDGGQDQVSVWLAQPGGGYGARTTYQVGSLPTGMAVGHFNNDAHLDIAVVHFSLSQVVFLRGNGDGTFQPRQSVDDIPVPSGFTTITTGDFDQNGTDDLAVAVDAGSFLDHTVRVLLNNDGATPSFTALGDANIGRGGPVQVAVGQSDAGLLPDLAILNFADNNIQLLLNPGSGNVVPQAPINVPDGPSSIAVADIDGNGTQDILGTSLGTNSVFQLLGNGSGSFTLGTPLPVGLGPRSITLVDIDGDNDQDILVGREANDAVLLRNEPTGFALPKTTGGSASFAQLFNSGVKQVVAMDLDGDGARDVATVGGSSGSGLVEVFFSSAAPGSHRLRLNGSDAAVGRNFGLTATAPAIPGDYDGSGTVDQADYAFWKTNFGATSGPGLAADGNNDGHVDAIDYAIWRENLDPNSIPLQGDYDGSGTVDQLDHAFWKTNFGDTAGPGLAADGNKDGRVDAIDYAIWRENLGATSSPSLLATTQSSAPGADTSSTAPSLVDAAVTVTSQNEYLFALPILAQDSFIDIVTPIAEELIFAAYERYEQLLLLQVTDANLDTQDSPEIASIDSRNAGKADFDYDRAREDGLEQLFNADEK